MSKEIGNKLKQERLNKKLTVDDVAGLLKIRKYYLEMMEAGNFKELPGLAYTIGFIRSYSRLLGIDAEPLIDVLKSGDSGSIHSVNVGLASSKMESALPTRSMIIISLLILVVVYVIWGQFFQSTSNKPEGKVQKPPVVIEKINIEESDVPLATKDSAPVVKEIEPATTQEQTKTSEPEVEKLNVVSVVKTDELDDIAQKTAPAQYGTENKASAKIIITALEDSWIQIRNDEELLFSKVLLEGDKYYVSNYNDELFLDTGNAGGIYITAEGERLPDLGVKGKVVRNFVLSEDSFEELKDNQSSATAE